MLFNKDNELLEENLEEGFDFEIEDDFVEEGCSKKEGCAKNEKCNNNEGCGKNEGCAKKEGCSKNEGCGKKSMKESDDIDDTDVSDDEVEESILFDDDAYGLFESVCGPEGCSDQEEIDSGKAYEDMRKDAFAFGATNDQIDGMIDGELGADAYDTVPDNVNILGANTDDFEYNETEKEDMDDDDDIEIIIDDEDIYGSDDK